MKKNAKSHRPQKARNRHGGRASVTDAASCKRPHPVAGTVAISAARAKAARRAMAQDTIRPRPSKSNLARISPHHRAAAQAIARDDDRMALALLLAPFLIIALSLVAERNLRDVIVRVPAAITSSSETAPAASRPGAPAMASLERREPFPPPAPPLPSLSLSIEPPLPPMSTLMAPPLPALATLIEARLPALSTLIEPPLPVLATLIEPALPSLATLIEPPLPALATLIAPHLPALAILIEPPLPSLTTLIDPPLPALARLIERAHPSGPTLCEPTPGTLAAARAPAIAAPMPHFSSPAHFGRALSDAARTQLSDFVIYNPKYVRIAYPMGDVPALFGVCTDVIVRAYRALGVDLQALVQETRAGTGDRNIDHRRVEVVRRFLARHGQSLPISDFAESYLPGDIVTYHRPQNRTTTAHIAIVTDRIAPSGRPMIVHNRGWGPQLEDALFVDRITGHYRFQGLATQTRSAAIDSVPPPPAKPSRLARQASRQIR